MKLTYKSALITGASAGIGEEFARQLAATGCSLVLVARRAEALEALADQLRKTNSIEVEVLAADLCDQTDLLRVAARLADERNPIDLLVNNAGKDASGELHQVDLPSALSVVQLNVVALFHLTHVALSFMIPRGTGGILNVSSVAGDVPNPDSGTYCATKAFVTSLGQSVHYEAKPHGVHVTTLLPGFVKTSMPSASLTDTLPAFAWVDLSKLVEEAIQAVSNGKVLCIPSVRYKVISSLLQMLPRALVREVSSRTRIGQ